MMDFIPYGKQTIDEDDIKSVIEVLKSPYLTTGPKIEEFEAELCKYTGAKYCVAVANGTAALHLASLVLLNKGDKVLTTANSFLATSNSILYVEAKPIFVDIQEDGNIDLDLCEEELKKDSSIKAIYVVHFSGNPVNQKKLKYLKETYNIKILEDCAHSLGASFDGIKAGSCENSDCSILSFHPVKHITTGEGGAVTTNSKELYEKLLELRAHGIKRLPEVAPWYYEMHSLGYNYRITDMQCALGISQLKKLDSFIKRRREIALKYDKSFLNSVVKPIYVFNGNSSYHLYVVKVDFSNLSISKIELFNKMREKNIGLQLHYIPINKQPYYKSLGYGDEITPIMEKFYEECFSLPIYTSLRDEEQEYVIKTLFEVLNA
ncbi:UDP-4-amino-4,6-dideoxy-N-acetyl-beta-L-altrosamine transaminase [Aliarcobacter cryaerophilus ATCC 43158]|uniref:UDP-4-amino-4,6-dideoxy-N-acetyl-beta-L-altrosamine transaminase n=1 Tax=Aliarcobacter cryaerophilus ATCC 43158 TaxID=1032070 RepID=A0AAD0TVU2_9BACT|nr:UDP-4-amino-4,6-dideoxy-N-acetyl-beta-L-altrosamine transaminase [Aliarcobacter cryaerophilus]AYJ79288.1 UDP-2-acetamido-2,6-dideoxy-beta-L-arabino-hex-4-ulose aminotransferase [Aliarcobacter cryaerophilus ATCC 43158]PRM96122.1 UDP-4-amino-4,6-dideoxy-N-acetyl-beta-L-altrosamine transaminase [Aliarcobacter cryaerophilus]QCZ23553.1 UDP-4-amino-4,6-dideoxy-N-acetyl-beta-L-altrosamine transaminase [Aliarcobacter cryaerophilus ATCC 43158]